jgi:hypothetical protein
MSKAVENVGGCPFGMWLASHLSRKGFSAASSGRSEEATSVIQSVVTTHSAPPFSYRRPCAAARCGFWARRVSSLDSGQSSMRGLLPSLLCCSAHATASAGRLSQR